MLDEHVLKSSRPTAPACPACGAPMTLRMTQQGKHKGNHFYGCGMFPDCRGTLPKPVGDALVAQARKAHADAVKAEVEREIADLQADDLAFLAFIERK